MTGLSADAECAFRSLSCESVVQRLCANSFVCCAAESNTRPVRIRSYDQNSDEKIHATIVKAALATSAATSFFKPVQIGSRYYVDGALRHNNPIKEVENEATKLWGSDQVELPSLVKCLVSIGTGVPATTRVSDSAIGILTTGKSLVVDTEEANQSFQERNPRLLREKRFFRYNVAQGLENVDLADYRKQGDILDATEKYMVQGEQRLKVEDCTRNLMEKEGTSNVKHRVWHSLSAWTYMKTC